MTSILAGSSANPIFQKADGETIDQLYSLILGRKAEDELKLEYDGVRNVEYWIERLISSVEFRERFASQSNPISTAEFLFPSRLRVTSTPINRLLLVGSCLTTEFSLALDKISGGTGFDFILYNNAADLPDVLPASPEDYTAQLLQIPLRSVLTDRIIQFKDFLDQGQQEELLQHAMATINVMLEAGLKYHRSHNIPAFVTNFIIPTSAISPSLKCEGTLSDIAQLIRRLNLYLAECVAALPNVFLLDLDALAGALGKDAVLDDWFHLFNHNTTFFDQWTETPEHPFYVSFARLHVADFRPSWGNKFFELIWRAIDAKIRTLRQVDQVKLVIFDLDNTLWRGQIAEHYRDGMEPPIAVGWPEGLPEAIHHLRARGILVAICSKNDEEIVRERWNRAIPETWLKLEDFVVAKINWKPKASNIAEILEETSLTLKSVVFVDDNPIERDAVATAFPGMRIIGENPFMTRSILLRAAETQVPVLTQESSRRETMIRKQIDREHERVMISREAFLQGLNCSIRAFVIADDKHPKFARALELINKTNQFNTTGRRWSSGEIASLFHNGGRLIAFNVADKFTDYGLVAVIILRDDLIEQFVMSCRVLGLEIERAAISIAIAECRRGGKRQVRALQVVTKENRVSQDVYPKTGFAQAGEAFLYDGDDLDWPAHIALTMDAQSA